MSWAETKYALNSSIGTDDFEPLDRMMQNQMFPSEQVAFFWIEEIIFPNEERRRSLKMGIDGSCKIRFDYYSEDSSGAVGTVKFFVNENEVYSINNFSQGETITTDLFEFKKGDVITMSIVANGAIVSLRLLKHVRLLGSVLPKKTFEEVI